jgi:hypothetical protein
MTHRPHTTIGGTAPALRGGATSIATQRSERCRMPWAHRVGAGLSLAVCTVSFAEGAPD